jgi:hypothetical protein
VTSPYIVGGYAVYWKFPSAVERTALSPNLNEVGRIAYQEDNDSFWYLKDVDTWVNVGEPESGSNAHGSYVKFADGTMICQGSDTKTTSAVQSNFYGSTSGNTYYASQTITLPEAYIDSNYAAMAATTIRGVVSTVYDHTQNNFKVEVRHSTNAAVVPFRWMTIGKWK